MLNQLRSDVQLSKELSATFSELTLFSFLKKAGITKTKGTSTLTLFTFLFSLIFEGKTLFCTLSNWRSPSDFKKDTVYRFMNDPLYNWRKFLLNVSSFVIGKLHRLTSVTSQARVLIVDDSSFYRAYSKRVENLAWQYDHALHRAYKGFRMLALGFSDGHSFIPVDFALLSGSNKVGKNTSSDQRTSGGIFKRVFLSVLFLFTIAIKKASGWQS